MSVEELLNKLENDRVEAERVRHECYERTREVQKKVKEAFDCALDVDDFYKQLDDLTFRLRDVEYAERMACSELDRITTTIDEIKVRYMLKD